jgi:hypothetical protein
MSAPRRVHLRLELAHHQMGVVRSGWQMGGDADYPQEELACAAAHGDQDQDQQGALRQVS